MNKKGYTLVEVIVSISILSIASITLAGAFSTIAHFMIKSNGVKEASNEMYSKIEGEKTDSNIKESTPENTKYEIALSTGKIEVNGTLITNQYKENDEVYLSEFKNKIVKNINVTDEAKKLYDLAKQYEQDSIVCAQCNIDGYIHVFNKIKEDCSNQFTEFPNDKLPINMTNQYIKIYYPWEMSKGNKLEFHGEPFIYLSSHEDARQENEDIKIFYNFLDKTWYYLKNGIMTIDTTKDTFTGQGDNRSIKINNDSIENWNELKQNVENNKQNWMKWKEDSDEDWIAIP